MRIEERSSGVVTWRIMKGGVEAMILWVLLKLFLVEGFEKFQNEVI